MGNSRDFGFKSWCFIMTRGALLMLVVATALFGCGSIDHKPRGFTQASVVSDVPSVHVDSGKPRKIVIFFDGTANDEGSDTNVKRLHSLVTLQDRGDIASLYVLGVGTDSDPVGAATGAGINARVKIAYEFILNHYRSATPERGADEVYIFGFSRGAFTARILTTMLYFAGIVKETTSEDVAGNRTREASCEPKISLPAKLPNAPREYTSTEIADAVHKTMFPGFGQGDADESADRPEGIFCELAKQKLRSAQDDRGRISVPVKVLGLWDSVQALGIWPMLGSHSSLAFRSTPREVNVDNPNRRYGERLCNVEYGFHALSLDDNRATVFTPLLLSRSHLFAGCFTPEDAAKSGRGFAAFSSPMFLKNREIKPGHLQEVWFSGAHSDVGGGYPNGAISGVSLNWMLEQLNAATPDLLRKSVAGQKAIGDPVRVREDVFGGSHNPTTGVWAIYPRVSRDLVAYAFQAESLWGAQLCIHESVFSRRRLIGHKPHEYDQLALKAPGMVQVELGPYGKQRDWEWLREVPRKDGLYDEIDVQKYPNCSFMPKSRWKGETQ